MNKHVYELQDTDICFEIDSVLNIHTKDVQHISVK